MIQKYEFKNLEIEDEELFSSFDLDELDEKLQQQLDAELEGLEYLKKESEEIGNPENLGEKIKDVVWEQFILQIGTVAGEDFIKENRGLTLDLSNDAHIQTVDNFKNGKFASHNTYTNYEERYDKWQENFQKDPNANYSNSNYRYKNGTWEKYDNRSGEYKKVLKKEARSDYDKGRPKGSNSKNTNMDHTISAGEIIRDEEAATYMTHEEKVDFANSEKNLNEMDSAANQSKGDSTMNEFLDSERDGKKPKDRFNIDEKELRKKDEEARKEYNKRKEEAKKKAIEEGKKSQKEEAMRIGKSALRAVLMQLLADLVKTIIGKLVKWLKTARKEISSLIENIKEAIKEFFSKIKTHIKNVGDTIFNTIATAIFGKIFSIVKKVWMIVVKAWGSLKDAINYLKDPINKNKPYGVRLLEAGKIVIAGLSGLGAIALGEAFGGLLSTFPILAIEIPLIGSLASIIGVFLGAVVSGIAGAIIINFIEKRIEKKLKQNGTLERINKGNNILKIQQQISVVNEAKLCRTKENIGQSIYNRHEEAAKITKEIMKDINSESKYIKKIDDTLEEIDDLLLDL